MKSGVEQLSPRLQNLSIMMEEVALTQKEHGKEVLSIKDTLNAMYTFFQDGMFYPTLDVLRLTQPNRGFERPSTTSYRRGEKESAY